MYRKQKKNLKDPASLAEHEATSSEPCGGNNTKHLPSQKKKKLKRFIIFFAH